MTERQRIFFNQIERNRKKNVAVCLEQNLEVD